MVWIYLPSLPMDRTGTDTTDSSDEPASTRRAVLTTAGVAGVTVLGSTSGIAVAHDRVTSSTDESDTRWSTPSLTDSTASPRTASTECANPDSFHSEDNAFSTEAGPSNSAETETAAQTAKIDSSPVELTRSSYTIREGTDEETTVYIVEAVESGPTVLVTGGVHGDEPSGYRAALAITDLEIDAGTLVVLPEANQPAIAADRRSGNDGDLNRHFPSNEAPTSELARAIWYVITDHDPDFVWDLHSSVGIYGEGMGVGQAVFPTRAGDARDHADAIKEYLNDHHVPDSEAAYQFTGSSNPDGTRPMLKHKVGADLDTPAIIFETYRGIDLETQVEWTKAAVRLFLEDYGMLSDG